MDRNIMAFSSNSLIENINLAVLFKQTAVQNPDKIALLDGDTAITYAELDRLSDQLAGYFQSQKIAEKELVGICLPRSINAILTILAIIKLGAVYVTISSDTRQNRLDYVIDNAKSKVFIMDANTFPKYSKSNCQIIQVETALSKAKMLSQIKIKNKNTPSDPAYVMYTSGTTGQTKGVIASHQSIIQLVKKASYVNISSEDVFLQLSPLEFDGSIFEIWGALLNGATLVLMPPGWPQLNIIEEKIRKNKISILFITTQLFNSLVDHKLESLLLIKQILFGGEQASIAHVRKFLQQMRIENTLCNIYGPTECTTFSTYYPLTISDLNKNRIPIGKPISAAITTYLLDKELSPVKSGEIGELYIGGSGVALGYLNDPDLSNEKFIASPFSKNPHDKIFKTGDKVKILPDGNIEFLGRFDRQIKIRGFRVSLEEIEMAIKEHPSIQDAAMQFVEAEEDQNLIAYLVVKDDQSFDEQQLKKFFLERHPSSMYPNKILVIDSLPKTSNGKIDYKNLLFLQQGKKAHDKEMGDSIMLDLEQEISAIWQKELRLDHIDLDNDFFDLGGHSLKLINILEVFHQHPTHKALHKLTIIDLFKYSTIRSLANWVWNTHA